MKKTKNNNRRDFLMNVCPTVAMAFLGITVLDSCSSGDDDTDYGNGSNNNNNNNNGNGNSTGTGYTVSGSTITIDLNHAMFSTLQSNNWINFTAQNMLILKISTLRLRFDTANFEKFDDDKLHLFLDKCQKDLISIDNLVEKTYF